MHIASLAPPVLPANPVVDTQILMNTVVLTRIVTIKSSFISRMCFHTQIYINFAREMKNKVRMQYQIITCEAVCWSWQIFTGSGPNHILQLLIPPTIIPYKPPCEIHTKGNTIYLFLIMDAVKNESLYCSKLVLNYEVVPRFFATKHFEETRFICEPLSRFQIKNNFITRSCKNSCNLNYYIHILFVRYDFSLKEKISATLNLE